MEELFSLFNSKNTPEDFTSYFNYYPKTGILQFYFSEKEECEKIIYLESTNSKHDFEKEMELKEKYDNFLKNKLNLCIKDLNEVEPKSYVLKDLRIFKQYSTVS